MRIKLLKDGDVIKFNWETKLYGRAEFIICPIRVRGELREVIITGLQQAGRMKHYKIIVPHGNNLSIGSWVGLSDPSIWITGWCKEHKCRFMRLYVPKYSEKIDISLWSDGLSLRFGKDDQ